MTVTFLREARSSAAKRPSRRSRRAGCDTPAEADRECDAAPGVVATQALSHVAGSTHDPMAPENHQHPVMAAHLDRGDRGAR
jgi:hypothetical protein